MAGSVTAVFEVAGAEVGRTASTDCGVAGDAGSTMAVSVAGFVELWVDLVEFTSELSTALFSVSAANSSLTSQFHSPSLVIEQLQAISGDAGADSANE
ncbi:MAG: hypothetical protein ACPF9K_08405 [Neptuniibacter sp.]